MSFLMKYCENSHASAGPDFGRMTCERAFTRYREKAVVRHTYVGWPFGMLGEHSLLSVNAVDERHPTNQYQEDRNEIPFL